MTGCDCFTKIIFNILRYLIFFKEESNTGLIHSWAKNCGKSMTLYFLSKLQGLAARQHPLLLSRGKQSTFDTSAYVS